MGNQSTESTAGTERISPIAVLGCGAMGSALVSGLCRAGHQPATIRVFDVAAEKSEALRSQHGVETAVSAAAAAQGAAVVILALKPALTPLVLEELRRDGAVPPLVVSIAAGVTLGRLRAAAGENTSLVRVMPNTPALIGKGMSAIYSDEPKSAAAVEKLLEPLGRTVVLGSEALLDCATGLSGSGPAFVCAFIEALAEGGVKTGLSREQASLLAAMTVFGTAAMVLETGTHPALLREAVTSPGGTTAAGLHTLEQAALRGAVISAVEAATERARALAHGTKATSSERGGE